MRNLEYLKNLNSAQKEAVITTEGPILVVAGAGSGKTRVLTYKIAYLMTQGVDPFNILALTFTNKAAKEMKERIADIVGGEAKNLWMGTFHSVFARNLRIEAHKIGYTSNFTIYDSDDSQKLVARIIKELNLDKEQYKYKIIFSRISSMKNNFILKSSLVYSSIIIFLIVFWMGYAGLLSYSLIFLYLFLSSE